MLESIDDHVIHKSAMLLRPGAQRRIPFRGTPGGRVQIKVMTKKGPGLGDTLDPVDDGPNPFLGGGSVFTPILGPTASTANLGPPAPRFSPVTATSVASATHTAPDLSGLDGPPGAVAMAPLPPELDPNFGGGGLVVGPDPPAIPPPPVNVSVDVRGGPRLGGSTPGPNELLDVLTPFPGHDIVDVTFTNPNDFPIVVKTFIAVRNDLDVSTTDVPRELLERIFSDTLVWLAPDLEVRDGVLRFRFAREAQETLGLDPVEIDAGIDIDLSLTISPVGEGIRLIDHATAIRESATLLKDDVPGAPNRFIEDVVDTFFSFTKSLEQLFSDDMGLDESDWKDALARQPLLTKQPGLAASRDDVALAFGYRLTEIVGGTSSIEVRVDSIDLELVIVLRSASRQERHPATEMRNDFVRGGFLMPQFAFNMAIGDVDIDVDIDLPGGIATKLFELAAEEFGEEVIEALVEWLKDDFAELVSGLGTKILNGLYSPLLGELATGVVRQIANRDHVFRHLRANQNGWVIDTLALDQLALPFVEPDSIDHRFDDIDDNLPTEDPIDGPMPDSAAPLLGRIDHMVFLMMENRSFDHMLGYLSHPDFGNRADVEGLDGSARSLGGDFVGTSATPQPSPRDAFHPSPSHHASAVERQIANGAMNGFVSSFAYDLERTDIRPSGNLNDPERILRFHTPDQLETYHDLTETALVLDHWYCSVPGGTYPNRSCYYTGVTPHMNNSELAHDAGYLNHLTLFELMDREGIDWIVYESDISFLRMFNRYRLNVTRIRPIEEFFARTEPLPPVTFIDPNFNGAPSGLRPPNDDHAPASIAAGQQFVDSVLAKYQQLDADGTGLALITYDEHGGFADHVPPPGTPTSNFPPDPDGSLTVPVAHPDARSYGVRVPTFLVSNQIERGGVGSRVYDHATVYRTIVERFMSDLKTSTVLPERVRRARHLGELIESVPSPPPFVGGADVAVAGAGGTAAAAPGRPSQPTAAVGGQPVAAGQPVARVGGTQPTPVSRGPGAVVHRITDEHRPHLAEPPDPEDFHELLRRIGNPFAASNGGS